MVLLRIIISYHYYSTGMLALVYMTDGCQPSLSVKDATAPPNSEQWRGMLPIMGTFDL